MMQFSSTVASFAAMLKDGVIGKGFTWGEATNVTVTGILIVFAMLVLLVLIIVLFGFVFDKLGKKEKKPEAIVRANPIFSKKAEEKKPAQRSAVIEIEDDGDEIIAVIAAAVNAMYEGSGKKPIIRSIKRAAVKRSAWGSAGVFENTRAF